MNLTSKISEKSISVRVEKAESQLSHYAIRAHSLWERSPELQRLYPNVNGPEYSRFIDTDAILHYRELQECGVKFPSWQDMVTVGGETDLRLFLQIGRGCYDVLKKYISNDESRLRLLDFGVGCARTARHFFRDQNRIELHGCDVDRTPIEYLQKHVPLIQAVLSSNQPPLPHESAYFDVIYSVSVFSHLNEVSFKAWAEELSRVVKLGGTLLLTIHGLHALKVLRTNNSSASIGIDSYIFNSMESSFEAKGFLWMPQLTGSTDIDTNQYGVSFVDRAQLEKFLPSSLKLVHYGEREIGNWQDLIVLKKV